MKGFQLKVVDKKKCRVVLEKHGYRKASNGDIYVKDIEWDIDCYITQNVYVNDQIVFTVEKAEEEVELDMTMILEMLSRKAISIVTYENKESPYIKLLNQDGWVKRNYLVGDYFATIVAIPNEAVNRHLKHFLVEFRGLKKPEWAKKGILITKDTYNHTFGDCCEVFPKAWVSLNEIKEIIR